MGVMVESLEIFQTVDDIPGGYFRAHRSVHGRVVSVTDGDTMRVLHTPPLSGVRRAITSSLTQPAEGSGRKRARAPKLSETTLQVRLAAVDTPEVGKFGKPSQAFAEEAREFAQQRVMGRTVDVRLLSRDQYGRAVASVRYPVLPPLPFPKLDLSEALVDAGLGVVYRQGGAQYDSPEGVAKWDRLEARAKARQRGLWAGKKVELPSAYKARMRAAKG